VKRQDFKKSMAASMLDSRIFATHLQVRILVGMGAVAPTGFESVGASTHGFLATSLMISSNFGKE